jgi:hypothetical protein
MTAVLEGPTKLVGVYGEFETSQSLSADIHGRVLLYGGHNADVRAVVLVTKSVVWVIIVSGHVVADTTNTLDETIFRLLAPRIYEFLKGRQGPVVVDGLAIAAIAEVIHTRPAYLITHRRIQVLVVNLPLALGFHTGFLLDRNHVSTCIVLKETITVVNRIAVLIASGHDRAIYLRVVGKEGDIPPW